MKVFSVQEIEKSSSGVAGIKIRGTFFDDKKAKEFYNKIVKEAMQKDWLYSYVLQEGNHGFCTMGLGRSAWGTHDGALYQFDIIENNIDISTTFDELSKSRVTSRQTQSDKVRESIERYL